MSKVLHSNYDRRMNSANDAIYKRMESLLVVASIYAIWSIGSSTVLSVLYCACCGCMHVVMNHDRPFSQGHSVFY